MFFSAKQMMSPQMRKVSLLGVALGSVILSACFFSTDSSGGDVLKGDMDLNAPIESLIFDVNPQFELPRSQSDMIVHSSSLFFAPDLGSNAWFSENHKMWLGNSFGREFISYLKFNANDSLVGASTIYSDAYKESLQPELVLLLDHLFYTSEEFKALDIRSENISFKVRWSIDVIDSTQLKYSDASMSKQYLAFRNNGVLLESSDSAFKQEAQSILVKTPKKIEGEIGTAVQVFYASKTPVLSSTTSTTYTYSATDSIKIPLKDSVFIAALRRPSHLQTLTLEIRAEGAKYPLRLTTGMGLIRSFLNFGLVRRTALQSAHTSLAKSPSLQLVGEVGDSLRFTISSTEVRSKLTKMDSATIFGKKGIYRAYLGMPLVKNSFMAELPGRYFAYLKSTDSNIISTATTRTYENAFAEYQKVNFIDHASETLWVDVSSQMRKIVNSGENNIGHWSLNLGRRFKDSTLSQIATAKRLATGGSNYTENYTRNAPILSSVTFEAKAARLKLEMLPLIEEKK